MIINYINGLQNISANSTTGIINMSNENFRKISEALYKFFTDIKYDEDNIGMNLGELTVDVIKLNSKVEMAINDTTMFSVDSNGKLFSKNIYAGTVCSELIDRLMYYEGFPKIGHAGDIVYGRNAEHNKIDFYGYVQNLGWLSLTGQGSGGGTPEVIEDINWNGAVLGFVKESELPSPAQRYGKYIVSDGEHKGQIAQYNFLTDEYEFIVPDDGTFIIDESEGTVYVAETNGDNVTWNEQLSCKIGKSENSDGYKDGINVDFTEKTPIGTAVDRFNKQINNIYDKSVIAYKNIMGVASTSNFVEEYDEEFGGGINLSSKQIFADEISTSPVVAVADGVVEYVEEALLDLVQKDKDSSYRLFVRKNGSKIYIKNIVTPYFGKDYRVHVYDSSDVEIEPKYYSLQYSSGILYFNNKLPKDVTPNRVSLYKYIGSTVADVVGSSSVKISYSDNDKHITSAVETNMKNTENVCLSGLVVTENPKEDSDFIVKVNGVAVSVGEGKDCYFVKNSQTKTFKNIAKGDELAWNIPVVGYKLDTKDVITFDYLVATEGSSASGGGIEPTPSGDSKSIVTLKTSANIPSNTFVHIKDDGTICVADSTIEGMTADGFVCDTAAVGEDCDVVLCGVVDVASVGGAVGEFVYLGQNGTYSSTVSETSNVSLQNVAKIVDTDKIFINFYEPIVFDGE